MQGNIDEADTVFKAFANSFEKSSSHWQARDEYLSDIKQDKNQTTAELDIYIKDLIRRCQFPPEDQRDLKRPEDSTARDQQSHHLYYCSTTVYNSYSTPNLDGFYPFELVFWHKPNVLPLMEAMPEALVTGSF